jgi:hypothetical protein
MKPIRIAIVLGFAILALSAAGRTEDSVSPSFTPQSLTRLVRKEHPRLLVTEAQFARLRRLVQKNAAAQEWYAAQKQAATRFLVEPPCSYKIAGGNGLLGSSRAILDRVYTLALLYKVEGGSRYLHRLWEELEAAAAFPDWHPQHFLDAAEMTHAFAIAYDWLFSSWTEPQRQVLARAIIDKGLKPALAAYQDQEKTGWWAASPFNWNLVVNSGIGLGALRAHYIGATAPSTPASSWRPWTRPWAATSAWRRPPAWRPRGFSRSTLLDPPARPSTMPTALNRFPGWRSYSGWRTSSSSRPLPFGLAVPPGPRPWTWCGGTLPL